MMIYEIRNWCKVGVQILGYWDCTCLPKVRNIGTYRGRTEFDMTQNSNSQIYLYLFRLLSSGKQVPNTLVPHCDSDSDDLYSTHRKPKNHCCGIDCNL